MNGSSSPVSTTRLRSAVASLTIVVLGQTLVLRWWILVIQGILWWPALTLGILLAVGLVALLPLGKGALRASLGGASRRGWVILGALLAATEYLLVSQLVSGARLMPSFEMIGFVYGLQYVLIGPVVEEFVYRGVMWHACRKVMRPWPAILCTAVAFALYHGPDRLADFPGLLLGGVVLGWLRHRSGSLQPCFVGHSVYNAMAMSYL